MATAQRGRQVQGGRNVERGEKQGDAFLIAAREGSRRIKLHDQQQQKAKSIGEAVVTTKAGLPDMRFAENRNLFEQDTSKKINGEPDSRFIENRDDLLEVHRRRGEDRKNLIFTPDMVPVNPGQHVA